MTEPDVSLVVPARDEAGNIGPLIAEIRGVLDAAGLTWELFVIDDGSTDGTGAEISIAAAADPRIVAIRHDRGLGKSAALMAGFGRSRGHDVVMLDGDGQDDPAEIPRLLARLDRESGVGLVNGWKTPRLDPWHKTMPSRVFNGLVGWLTGLRLHDHNCGLKAMRGEVARGLALDTDMHRFITVLAWLAGHRVIEQPVHHRPRLKGVSKYGPSRFVTGLADLWKVAGLVPESRRVRGESRARLRHGIYAILAAVALGGLVGRIGAVASVDKLALEKRLVDEAVAKAVTAGLDVDPRAVRARVEQEKRLMRPFLSANDRSRWMTIRSLVERGTFAIDEIAAEPGWDTIDAVAHPDASGRLRLYSSKPPLLSVICAGPYWLLHKATGWTLGDHPFELGRMLMLLFGVAPLLVVILFSCRLIDAVGTTDWGRVWAVAVICCGTLLTTFAVVLTNHLPAAACAAVSGWLLVRIGSHGLRSWWAFAAAGLTAALTAAFELPALAWLAAVLVMLARRSLRQTLTAAVPTAALVAAAALGTNWLAHGTISPPYAHREPQPAAPSASEATARLEIGGDSWNPGNWYDFALTLPNGKRLESYWRSPKGVDRGERSPAAYAWHVLLGHHGLFSLTPAWLLVIPGLAMLARRSGAGRTGQSDLAAAIAIVSAVVIAFYLSRSQLDRNYGGMVSGFRWAFWLAPLWVMATVPAADRLGNSRAGRGIALILLALSVLSAAYPTWNPWTLPWIQQWLIHAGWLAPPG
ncbi:MAG: glycosyltransferase family 2 protein [Pirellulales bacterium]